MDTSSLPSFLVAEPALAAGVVARMAAAVAAGGLPVFPRLDIRVRVSMALALAAVAAPTAAPAAASPALLPLLAGEAVVGCGLGLAVATVFGAASWAGGILGGVTGLNWADEPGGDEAGGEAGIARLAGWLAVAGFLAAGGHLAVVAGLVESVQRLPVGAITAGGIQDGLLDLAAVLPQVALGLAVSLAAPALTAVIAFHVAAAIGARAIRLTPGAGLLPAAASLVLLAAVLAGAAGWTAGFAAAVQGPLEQALLESRP